MTPADRLGDSLAALRDAVRQGDFSAFDRLSARLGAEVAELEAAPPDPGSLQMLKLRAAELSELLQAAGQGLAAARRRLTEIDTLRKGLGTYGGDGRRRALGPTPASTRRV